MDIERDSKSVFVIKAVHPSIIQLVIVIGCFTVLTVIALRAPAGILEHLIAVVAGVLGVKLLMTMR